MQNCKHESGDWYCFTCEAYLVDERITVDEECNTCFNNVTVACKHCTEKDIDNAIMGVECN